MTALDALTLQLRRDARRGAAASLRLVREAEELVAATRYVSGPPATVHSRAVRGAGGLPADRLP